MNNTQKNFKDIQNHLASSGFVFQGSQIYGGLANTWDYGPLGVLLNNKIKKLWWSEFVTKEPNNFGLDSKIIMNPSVWKASGHIGSFSDPLIENKVNGKRYRADKIIEELYPETNAEAMSKSELEKFIKDNIVKYEGDKTDWSEIREFHLMFETKQGVIQDKKDTVYLRPETAQGIFVNFKNVQRSMRTKVPFGIGQVGKSFRNEVTPGNFTFRTREFEQMELEYFVKPGNDDLAYKYYVDKSLTFARKVGIKETSLRLREHNKKELAHYAKGTTDIEFAFPFGWAELMGIANRTDYDLKAHMSESKESLEYLDPVSNKKYVPYVIEPSMGLDRLALAILVDSYVKETVENGERIILKIQKDLAPYQVSVMPLSKNHHQEAAKKVYTNLVEKGLSVSYDETGSIGKRYRRQDSIGTPIIITVIDETSNDGTVTIRHRDSMQQETINIKDIKKYL